MLQYAARITRWLSFLSFLSEHNTPALITGILYRRALTFSGHQIQHATTHLLVKAT